MPVQTESNYLGDWLKFEGNCLACFGPVGFQIFAVFQAFSGIRKNRSFQNHGVSQRATPQVVDSMGHETLNKYVRRR